MRLLMFCILLIAMPAWAQERQVYIPFTVEQKEFEEMGDYLMKQPMGVVEPVVQWLRRKEADAQRKAKEKKPEEGK